MKSLLRSGVSALMGMTALLAMSATSAFAGQGYSTGAVAGTSTGGSGTLPFTGADIALYAVVGGLVAGSGLALRRYTARRSS